MGNNATTTVNESSSEQLEAYSKLLSMGFDGNVCYKAASKYPNNLDEAINYISNIEGAKGGQIEKKEEEIETLCVLNDSGNENIVNIQVNIEHPRRYKCSFIVNALYSQHETTQNVLDAAINYLEKKYHPTKFALNKINTKRSFIRNEMETLSEITRYEQQCIVINGLEIEVEVKCYEHKVSSQQISCQHMKSKNSMIASDCPIYEAMKDKYEWSRNNLNHLNEYIHFADEYNEKPECKYNGKCTAFIRLEDGDNKLDDLCHVKLYKHPPRSRNIKLQENINSLIVNKKKKENHELHIPTSDDYDNDKDGYLIALIKEVVSNGFESDLCLTDDDLKEHKHSIMQIVEEKLESNRHKMIGTPLRRDMMLALILYTGCDCNYDLCKSQRNGDYTKWKWFDYCLYWAIVELSGNEFGTFCVFSGLNQVKLDKKLVKCGYFVTYVSASWSKEVAESFMNGDGMIIRIDKSFKNDRNIDCCDVSWISKFPDECEVLFARSTDASSYFDGFHCKVLDESNGVQYVSLSKENYIH